MNGHLDLLTVSEAALRLRISKNLAYEMIRQELLPHLHLGRRVIVPALALERWVEQVAEQSLQVSGHAAMPSR